jgi:hypothetical protein
MYYINTVSVIGYIFLRLILLARSSAAASRFLQNNSGSPSEATEIDGQGSLLGRDLSPQIGDVVK